MIFSLLVPKSIHVPKTNFFNLASCLKRKGRRPSSYPEILRKKYLPLEIQMSGTLCLLSNGNFRWRKWEFLANLLSFVNDNSHIFPNIGEHCIGASLFNLAKFRNQTGFS